MLRSSDIQNQLEHGRILLKMTSCASFDSILVLSLRELQLTSVFKYITKCVNLKILFLSGNHIQPLDIEKYMCKLQNVRKLDLSMNELSQIPKSHQQFAKMASLEFLVLNENNFTSTEQLLGLKGVPKLRYLSLADNPIQKADEMYRYNMAGMLPNLYGLDQNSITYDEMVVKLDNKSVRYCSMNTFSQLDRQITMTFIPDFSASKHLRFLDEQLSILSTVSAKNNPVIAIQRSFRAASMRVVVTLMLNKIRKSILRIQKHARGWLCRLNMKKQLLSYFDSMGEIELTMSPKEVREYRAMKAFKEGMPRLIHKFRVWRKFTKIATVVSKVYQSQKVRKQLTWALDKPLNLGQHPCFTILKEQKYLIKHIMVNQTRLSPEISNSILELLEDDYKYKLMKPVDLDLYVMPSLPILQISMPPKLVKVAHNKSEPSFIKEKRSIFEMCIPKKSDSSMEQEQLANLRKLKQFYRKMSSYEIAVARQEIFPQRKLNFDKKARQNMARDNFMMSSHASESPTLDMKFGARDYYEQDTQQDKNLFSKILRKSDADFMRIDLSQSNDPAINSSSMALQVLRIFIRWNIENPENSFHFYCGDLLERQLAVNLIQKWYRKSLRIREERQIMHMQIQEQKNAVKLFQPNSLTFLICLRQKRAAVTIQQYWSMYRLRRRIKMLASLKDYLSRVTSSTLCIEQNLYQNITSIQYSCLYNNSIPEAHCFAFDFIENPNKEHGAWDLVYTYDSKDFRSLTNQLTHEAVKSRFNYFALPKWVVKDDLELSIRSNLILSDQTDRNNTTQIFHKTQMDRSTEVLDYNQIVAPENRTFVVNNGLRFVVVNCFSVVDAKRRALALAMITLNRKKGDFLKIFCPDQLFSGTFLPNIQCWWNLKEIKERLPLNYMKHLTLMGGAEVQALPLRANDSHNGFILSQKDYYKAEAEDELESVQIQRKRNDDELQMKLVIPNQRLINQSIMSQSRLNLNLDLKNQKIMSQVRQNSMMTTNSIQNSYLVPKEMKSLTQEKEMVETELQSEQKQKEQKQIIIKIQGSASEVSSSIDKAPIDLKLEDSMKSIESGVVGQLEAVQQTETRQSASHSSEIVEEINVKNQDLPIDGMISSKKEVDTRNLSRPNTSGAILKKQLNPQNNQQNKTQTSQMYADKARKQLVASSQGLRGVNRPPKQPQKTNFKSGRGSLESRKLMTKQSQTTKEDSTAFIDADADYSLQNRNSVTQFESKQNLTTQSRVQSGMGLRMKSKLESGQNKIDLPSQTYLGNKINNDYKVRSTLNIRRPMTSIQSYQQDQQPQTIQKTDASTLREITQEDHIKEQTFFTHNPSIGGETSMEGYNQGYRIKSAIYNRQEQQNNRQTQRKSVREIRTERLNKEKSEYNIQRQTDRFNKQIQDKKAHIDKSIKVHKQRTVSHLIQNSIKYEQMSKINLVQKLGKYHKEQNIESKRVKQAMNIAQKSLQTQKRAQSSYMIRSQQSQSKNQAQKLSGAVNMLNKVNLDQIKSQQKRDQLKTAQGRAPYLGQIIPNSGTLSVSQGSQSFLSKPNPSYRDFKNNTPYQLYIDSNQGQTSNKLRNGQLTTVHDTLLNRAESSNQSLRQTEMPTQRLNNDNQSQYLNSHASQDSMMQLQNPTSMRNIVVSKQIDPDTDEQNQQKLRELVQKEQTLRGYFGQPTVAMDQIGSLFLQNEAFSGKSVNSESQFAGGYPPNFSDYNNAPHYRLPLHLVQQMNNNQQVVQRGQSEEILLSNQVSSYRLQPMNQGGEGLSSIGTPLYAPFEQQEQLQELSQSQVQVQQATAIPSQSFGLLHHSIANNAMITNGAIDQHTMRPSGEINMVSGMVDTKMIKANSGGAVRPYSGEINRDIEIDMKSGRKQQPSAKMANSAADIDARARTTIESQHVNQQQHQQHHMKRKTQAIRQQIAIPVVMKQYQIQTNKNLNSKNKNYR